MNWQTGLPSQATLSFGTPTETSQLPETEISVYLVNWLGESSRVRYSEIFEYLFAYMMTSSNGNIFHVTGPLWGAIHRSPLNSPHKGQWRGALMLSLSCAWIHGWANNGEAGDLRRYRVLDNVTVVSTPPPPTPNPAPPTHPPPPPPLPPSTSQYWPLPKNCKRFYMFTDLLYNHSLFIYHMLIQLYHRL